MTKPYKLTRDYRPAGGETTANGATIASYATLSAAVAGAKREFSRTSDTGLEVHHAGKSVRNVYRHGRPSEWIA